jgi:hypothetical protein
VASPTVSRKFRSVEVAGIGRTKRLSFAYRLEASSGTIEVLGESLRALRGVVVSDERAVVVVTHDNWIFSFAAPAE